MPGPLFPCHQLWCGVWCWWLLHSLYKGEVIYWVKGSVVQCMFCFEICTPEGRGKEGGDSNLQIKHTEPFTQEIP